MAGGAFEDSLDDGEETLRIAFRADDIRCESLLTPGLPDRVLTRQAVDTFIGPVAETQAKAFLLPSTRRRCRRRGRIAAWREQ
jgi:hypothetical protein